MTPHPPSPDSPSVSASAGGDVAPALVRTLRVSQQWLQPLIESNLAGIMVVADHTIVEANDALLGMLGASREDLAAGRLHCPTMTPAEYREADAAAHEQLLRHGRCPPYEKEYLRREGGRIPVLIGAVLLTRVPCRWVCFVLDRTEQRVLERRARQAQRIEAVVQLAGGIAHDFNNVLTAIIGSSELLRLNPSLDTEAQEDVARIRQAAARAAQLTHQLLAFSRRQVLQPRVLDLNAVVDDMRRLLRRVLGDGIELVCDLAPDLDPTLADLGQLERVILDLSLRARDAMPAGGRLTLATANVHADGALTRRLPGLAPGRYATLTIADTGVGLNAAALERIFEPFSDGPDGGFGLASVHGIARQSGGYVDVRSDPGRGTAFTLYLPAAERPVPRGEAAPVAGGEGETVLLVEDEEPVLKLTRLVLERHGYTVVAASNAATAMAAANRYPGPIHLLVVDMVLPDSSGRELAAQLAIHRPAIKVLYISGTSDNAIDRHRVLAPGTEFLQKPFAPDQLVSRIRKVLDAPLTRS